MRKAYKIILACVCAAVAVFLLAFGFRKMADTAPATERSQNTDADSTRDIKVDDARTEGGRKIRLTDGSEVILANPSVLGDDFDSYNFDFSLTGDHE